MAVYEKQGSAGAIRHTETHLYGSSRLGIVKELTKTPVNLSTSPILLKKHTFTRGEKFFELSNHLGNVLAVIADKKIPVGAVAGVAVNYFMADVVTATDYYTFGMAMPGRNGLAYQSTWVPGRGFVAGNSYPDYLAISSRPYAPTPNIYRAGKEIELLPGFETATATDELTIEIVPGSGVLSTDYLGGQGSYESYGYYRYGFNGKENDNEVKGSGNSIDFGARIYDSRVGRWLSVDPLQSKYPDLSPYNFAGNSQITFYDPNGKEIIINYKDEKGQMQSLKYVPGIKPTIDNNFVQQIHTAVSYVMKDDPSKTFQKLSVHAKSVTINEQLTGSSSRHEINSEGTGFVNVSIYWGANFGQIVNGTGQAPSTILLHEAAHALGKLNVNGKQELAAAIKSREFDGTDFTNKEERRVITEVETPYVQSKNKTEANNIKYLVPPVQGTRNDHYGEYYPTKGVNSITPIDGKTNIPNTGKTLQDELKPKIDKTYQTMPKKNL